jgi:hypothetical protein
VASEPVHRNGARLATGKVHSIEAMSDIEVRNANAFYRALGMKQASYRFTADT